jgi:hypothetical protein
MNRSKAIAGIFLSTLAVFAVGGCQQAPPPAAPAPTVIVEHDHHDADRAAADRAAADRQAAADRAAADRAAAERHDDHRDPQPH